MPLARRARGVHAVVRWHLVGRGGRAGGRRSGLVIATGQLVCRAPTTRRDRGAAVGRDLAVRGTGAVPLALIFGKEMWGPRRRQKYDEKHEKNVSPGAMKESSSSTSSKTACWNQEDMVGENLPDMSFRYASRNARDRMPSFQSW